MPDRILRKTSPVQVPLLPRLAELVASTRKDLIPIAGAYDFANEEWRKRLQLALETAIATAVIGLAASSSSTVVGIAGPAGAAGARGPTGPAGVPGADGSDGTEELFLNGGDSMWVDALFTIDGSDADYVYDEDISLNSGYGA